MKRLLITTLAEYQTIFWLAVGKHLRALGHPVAFLSFDDRSSDMLVTHDFKVYSAVPRTQSADNNHEAIFQQFGVTHLNHWLSHERFAFGITNTPSQLRRFSEILNIADAACRDWGSNGDVVLIQELGGFLSVVGSYFAARRNNIDNWFIEPSFFRGRMFFLRNHFSALKVSDSYTGIIPDDVLNYLNETLQKGTIVIPKKDSHQYTTAFKKIINFRNARRLFQKLIDKYIHQKKQEFGHIGSYVLTHMRMLWSSYKLRSQYSDIGDGGNFIYYPLHVPGDMALTLRSPHLLDQLSLIDILCRSVPVSHKIAIKEHPAMIGAVDCRRLRELLRRYDNLHLLSPSINNYEVIRKAAAVVSINSKSGAEAALLGKPVLVLGDAFYGASPLVHKLNNIQDLPSALSTLLNQSQKKITREMIERYFAAVWFHSCPGELYVDDPDNVRIFSQSLIEAITKNQP